MALTEAPRHGDEREWDRHDRDRCAVELHRDLVIVELKLTGLKLGYLLNFGEALMRDGITRIIHGNLDPDPPCLGASVRGQFIEPAAGGNTE